MIVWRAIKEIITKLVKYNTSYLLQYKSLYFNTKYEFSEFLKKVPTNQILRLEKYNSTSLFYY